MRTCFVVNDRTEPSSEQTTTLLIAAAVRRGHDVIVCGVDDFEVEPDGTVHVRASPARGTTTDEVARHLGTAAASSHSLHEQDLCIIRTNPGRDEARRAQHVASLRLLESLQGQGLRIINRPSGLSRAITKLSLLEVPERLRPRTLVTRDGRAIETFLDEGFERIVVKPLDATRGHDVFVLDREGSRANTKQILEVVLRRGYAMAQEFVPGAERGDVRVTVVQGRILEVNGRAAAVARVPAGADFRSNLHAGGQAREAEVTDAIRDAVSQIAPMLAREGLTHVGVDFIGGLVLELNVFSPGGLVPCERLYGVDFGGAVIEALERDR